MKKFSIIFFSLCLVSSIESFSQEISLDISTQEEEIMTEPFEKSTMYYLSPVSSFGYSFGYRNMQEKLERELGLNSNRLIEFIGIGMGIRRKLMFYNFRISFSPFSNTEESVNGNLRTISQTSDGFFDLSLGRALIANDRYYLILRTEVGVYARSLQIRQFEEGTFYFDHFENVSGKAWPELEHISGTYGVVLEYMPKALRTLSVLESIEFGYKGGIGFREWKSNDLTVENSFTDQPSMLFLKFSIVISREK